MKDFVKKVNAANKSDQPPPRYNQSSLLQKMEAEGIGTKTTRAEVISTLFERGYVIGESIMATDVGFAVVEAMQRHSPSIISTEMTKNVERDLGGIERGNIGEDEVIEKSVEQLVESLSAIKDAEEQIGREIRQAIISTTRAQNILGPCPICKTGKLTVIRSRKTGKRFVGCTNYGKGCRASAPLPQRWIIKTSGRVCETCGWPVIYVKLSRVPWKLCVNARCPAKEKRKEATIQKPAKVRR